MVVYSFCRRFAGGIPKIDGENREITRYFYYKWNQKKVNTGNGDKPVNGRLHNEQKMPGKQMQILQKLR